MIDQAQPVEGVRTAISWRAAVDGSDAARLFSDGRPVYGVDEAGRIVVANRAAAVFGGGAVRFGEGVPPGGTIFALIARFAAKAKIGDSVFERTRAVIGLRASMLGLKLTKIDVPPLGRLTLVTFAEGIAPVPDEGGVLGDPRDELTPSGSIGGEPTPEPSLPAVGMDATALSDEIDLASTMEDPFSDASFAAFSPISVDLDEWTSPSITHTPIPDRLEADTIEPPMAAALLPDAASLDEAEERAARREHAPNDAHIIIGPPPAPSAMSKPSVATEAALLDMPSTRVDGGVIPSITAGLPIASDAIVMGVWERPTIADSAYDRAGDGVASLLALDAVEDEDTIQAALAAEVEDLTVIETELEALDAVAATPMNQAPEPGLIDMPATAPASEPSLIEPSLYQGRAEPHRFVWQMDGARRFTLVSRELADAVGATGENLVGRAWRDVAGALGLDPDGRVETALGRRDTWSGLTVFWPVEGAPVRVPVDLAALPSFGRNRSFDGYRGFGVCRTADWREDETARADVPETDDITTPDHADPLVAPAAAMTAPLDDNFEAPAADVETPARAMAAIAPEPIAAETSPTEPNWTDSIPSERAAADLTQGTVLTALPTEAFAPASQTAPASSVPGIDLTDEEDPLPRKLNDELDDGARSAFDDGTTVDTPDAAPIDQSPLTPVDPDIVALAEGTALPLTVAAPPPAPAAIAPTMLAADGAGLRDAVAELSDYLNPTDETVAMAPTSDVDHVGLPTWHEAVGPEGAGDNADEASADTASRGETDAFDEGASATALGVPAVHPMIDGEPAEAALILDDVAEKAADAPIFDTSLVSSPMDLASLDNALSVETPLTAARDQGLPADDRFGLMNAIAASPSAERGESPDSAERGESPDSAEHGEGPNSAERGEGPDSAEHGEGPDSAERGEGPDSAERGEGPDSAERGEGPDSAERGEGPDSAERGEGPDSAERGESPNSAERGEIDAPSTSKTDDIIEDAGTVPAVTRSQRPDRASLSEIAAALNQEMRAREAEALNAASTVPETPITDTPDTNESVEPARAPSLASTEPPVALVPPQRPDNVITAPIGPGAKVVTLPAGPRVIERPVERGPLSPPERDAFRQIARVLGARMEDEPAPPPTEATSTPANAATDRPTFHETIGETEAPAPLMAGVLAPEASDRLIGSLGDPSDARDVLDGEARFVEARALTDLSIDNDEAAFVADGDLEALATEANTNQLALFADADAVAIDEGAEAAFPLARLDDLVGEGEVGLVDIPQDDTETTDASPAIADMADSREAARIDAPATSTRAGSLEQPVLQEFPMAVAVVQGQDIPFANPAFLELLGYSTLDDLNAAGGLDALFAGPHALKGWTGDASIRPLPAITRDGAVVPVCVRIAKTRWADAPALVMAMETAERAAAGLALPAAPIPPTDPTPPVAEPAALVGALVDEPRDTDDLDPRARIAELEAVLDTATDGVAILDAEGTVVSMNRAGQALFGADATSLEGRKLADLLAPESRRAAQDYLDGLSRNGVQSLLNDGREVIALEAGGGLVPLFMTIGRLGEGRARAFCAVMRDITQWKKAEEELTAAKKHAELASLHKSDFLAKISHEIRTPLNAIMGFAEVMIDERFGPIGTERYKEYLKDIRTSGAHIMSLVNDLLDLSKIEAGKLDLKFEAVDLNAILRECVALMQPQANRERIIIRASLPTGVPPIVADSRSIRQIMLNLLSNAVKFTPAGGQVIVSTALEDQGQVALRVRDTGIGMTETEVTQALEPFRQVHTAKSGAAGTGLGLPLTKALVEANRAAFAIRSTPGQGTLVEIVFPSTRVLAS